MLLKRFEQTWSDIQTIGADAEAKAKASGLTLTWPTSEDAARPENRSEKATRRSSPHSVRKQAS